MYKGLLSMNNKNKRVNITKALKVKIFIRDSISTDSAFELLPRNT
jgi:hypothetical protein